MHSIIAKSIAYQTTSSEHAPIYNLMNCSGRQGSTGHLLLYFNCFCMHNKVCRMDGQLQVAVGDDK